LNGVILGFGEEIGQSKFNEKQTELSPITKGDNKIAFRVFNTTFNNISCVDHVVQFYL
jgi:hypothetical protein